MATSGRRKGISVAIRTRPTAAFAQDEIVIDEDASKISVHSKAKEDEGVNNRRDDWGFRFHHVLHNAAQEVVYDRLCNHVVRGAMEGTNGTIMAYGQTGAGKTFTMIGDTNSYRNRGVSPRTLAHVFQEVGARPETAFDISVSYMEIYNERIFDLLRDGSKRAPTGGGRGAEEPEYTVVDDPEKGTMVRGLTMHPVTSEEEALDALFQGELNRTTAEHLLNKSSNRSHCIFTIHISQRSRLGTAEHILGSKLHLVDLAGSERLKKTLLADDDRRNRGGHTAEIMADEALRQESMYINKSLTYLEQCVVALTSPHRSYVPYRQTKLTNILKDSLGGNCNTLLIACIWTEPKHLEETISTLKLAQRMMRVQNRAVENVTVDPSALVVKYERQIRELKQELAMHDALTNRSHAKYDDFTPEEQEALSRQIQSFLRADTEEEEESVLPLTSVRQMREILRQFKVRLHTVERETEDKLRTVMAASRQASRGGDGQRNQSGAGADRDAKDTGAHGAEGDGAAAAARPTSPGMVGDLEQKEGFGLGMAAATDRPTTTHAAQPGGRMRQSALGSPATTGGDRRGAAGGGGGVRDKRAESPLPRSPSASRWQGAGMEDREAAWARFRSESDESPGRKYAADVRQAKEEVQAHRRTMRDLAEQVNGHKREIDAMKQSLKGKREMQNRRRPASRGRATEEEEEAVDEEEFRLMEDLKAAKEAYRSAYERFQAEKETAKSARATLDRAREAQLSAFVEWYAEETGEPLEMSDLEASMTDLTETEGGWGDSLSPSKFGGFSGFGGSMTRHSPKSPGFEGEARDEDGDLLDDQEAFERLEAARVEAGDPDALAYFHARKHMKTEQRRRGGRPTAGASHLRQKNRRK